MGIPRAVARLLLDEHHRRPFQGSVLEIGRMTIHFGREELEQWARLHHVELQPLEHVGLSHEPLLAAQGCLDDRSFFRLLGFDEVTSCDYSQWEGADLEVDLNRPIPEIWKGRFDAVVEVGTIQHIFDLPQVLLNMHDFLRPGGRVIHGMLPSSNHVDHGFYMFSPTLFAEFYRANGYRIDRALLLEFSSIWHRGRFYSEPWRLYDYTPGSLDHLSYGGFGSRQLGIFIAATRTERATGDVAPQQAHYARYWQPNDGGAEAEALPIAPPAAPPKPSAEAAIVAAVDRALERWPALDRPWVWFKSHAARIRRLLPRRMPPLVGRY